MRGALLVLFVALLGCTEKEPHDLVPLPRVPPDTVVVSWSVISRSADRDSLQVLVDAGRDLVATNRTSNGTMMSVSRKISKKEYAALVAKLRELDCCLLESTSAERSSPEEAKPRLEIDFGDMKCEIERWDREWLQGLARDCGFAFAGLHGAGFVPDPPVDESTR